MENKEGGDSQKYELSKIFSRCFFWSIKKIHDYLEKSRANKKQESATDRAATSTARATWAIAALTIATIGVGICQFREMHAGGVDTHELAVAAAKQADAALIQAKTAQEQFALLFPPKLRLDDLHIWEHGKGEIYNPANALPSMKSGNLIDGTAVITNIGRNTASIVGSDVIVTFAKHLTMNYPGWRSPGDNSLRPFSYEPPYALADARRANAPLQSGESERWALKVTVPSGDDVGSLYVIGTVVYQNLIGTQDTLGTRHALYFVEKYDPSTGTFLKDETRNKQDDQD